MNETELRVQFVSQLLDRGEKVDDIPMQVNTLVAACDPKKNKKITEVSPETGEGIIEG